MFEDDAFQNIPDSEISTLLNILKPHFPHSINAYYFIDNLLRWKHKEPDMDIGILTPKEGLKSGAVFFYVIGFDHISWSAYIWSEEGGKALQNALLETKRFDWSKWKYFLMICLTNKTWSVIEPVLSKLVEGRPPVKTSHDNVYWLPAEEILKFNVEIPEGMKLDAIKEEHIDKINSLWPHRFDGSDKLMKMMLTVNCAKGLFKSDGELISWAFYWFFGALGVVQTIDSEKRKGYGNIVVKAVCKEMALLGLDVNLNIVKGNLVSEAFFKNLGFRHAFDSIWAYSVK